MVSILTLWDAFAQVLGVMHIGRGIPGTRINKRAVELAVILTIFTILFCLTVWIYLGCPDVQL